MRNHYRSRCDNFAAIVVTIAVVLLPFVAPSNTTTTTAHHNLPEECHSTHAPGVCNPDNILSAGDMVGIQLLIDEFETFTAPCQDEVDIHDDDDDDDASTLQLGIYIHYEPPVYNNTTVTTKTILQTIDRLTLDYWNFGQATDHRMVCSRNDTWMVVYIAVTPQSGKGRATLYRGSAVVGALPQFVLQTSLHDMNTMLNQNMYAGVITTTIYFWISYMESIDLLTPIWDAILNSCIVLILVLIAMCTLAWIIREYTVRRQRNRMEYEQHEQVQDAFHQVQEQHYSPSTGTYKSSNCAICQKPLDDGEATAKERANSKYPSVINNSDNDDESTSLLVNKSNDDEDKGEPSVVSLSCGHEFHNTCLLQYMEQQKRHCDFFRCPVCMQGIVNSFTRPSYSTTRG